MFFYSILILYCIVFNVNGIPAGDTCDWSSDTCRAWFVSQSLTCDTGSSCQITTEDNYFCGIMSRCVANALPTPHPTLPPTLPPKKKRGEFCDTITVNTYTDCDQLNGNVFECVDGLECIGEYIDRCGTYKACLVPPTPYPTLSPTLSVGYGESCCPDVDNDECGNAPLCNGGLICVSKKIGDIISYSCASNRPTRNPTSRPSDSPTNRPTAYEPKNGDICFVHNSNEDYHNACEEGTICIPNNDDKDWYCRGKQQIAPSSIDDNAPFVVNSKHKDGMYTRSLYFDNRYIVASNPSNGKVDVYNGDTLQHTFGHSNSGFASGIATYGEWLIVGAPDYAQGGAVFVYRSVVNGPSRFVIFKQILSLNNDVTKCGNEIVFSDDGKYFFVTCDSQHVMVGTFVSSTQSWNIIRTVTIEQGVGKSISTSGNYLVVGNEGSISIYDIQNYIINQKTGTQYIGFFIKVPVRYYRTIRPLKFDDDNFGHSVSLSPSLLMVGTGTNKVYRIVIDGFNIVDQEIHYYDVPSHDIVFEPYTRGEFSFAHSKSKAMVFKDGLMATSEWGPPFDPNSSYDKIVTVSPITDSKLIYTRNDIITAVDITITKQPTTSPTPLPTTSPTLSPIPEPYFDYVERVGRSCGIDNSFIKRTTTTSLDVCKEECTRLEHCRCFDRRVFGDNVKYCNYYSSFDTQITWAAGRTYSYVKKSEDILNVKLVLYVIESDGTVIENKDVRAEYDVDIRNIKIHTTHGEIGAIWKYVPDEYTPPSDINIKKNIPVDSNNPHPVTYDGYISIIGSKILMVDYDLTFLRDVPWQDDVTYIVTMTVETENGNVVYYNSHSYIKLPEEISCGNGNDVYNVNNIPSYLCPEGTLDKKVVAGGNEERANGYNCFSLSFLKQDLTNNLKGYVYYYNDGIVTPPFKWNHCMVFDPSLKTGLERQISAQLASYNRADTKSQFVFSPGVHNIKWEEFGSENVADPSDTPVIIRFYNFQDNTPLVISDILFRDKNANVIKALDDVDIAFIGGDPDRQYLTDDIRPVTCPISGTHLINSCKDFGYNECCGVNQQFTKYEAQTCTGTRLYTERHTDTKTTHYGEQQCNDNIDCIGFEWTWDRINTGTTFVYYSKITGQRTCTDCSPVKFRECFVADVKSSRYAITRGLVKVYNKISIETFDCYHDRSTIDVKVDGYSETNLCDIDPDASYIDAPYTTVVESRAAFEIQVDGKDVEYVDIGVGASTNDNKPSSYYYEIFHHGIKINDGVFYKSNLENNRKTIHINNAGDTDGDEVYEKRYNIEGMTLYGLLCDAELGDHWYNSHVISTIINNGGITVADLCTDAESAFKTLNPSIFNDIMYVYRIEMEQTITQFESTFLDGTYKSFMEYETSNSLYPPTVDTVTAAIDFLIGIGKMFECGNTTDKDILENMDSEALAESFMLEYRFPTRYKSICDNLKYSEDMYYEGKTYNVGHIGAPCISNAMCHDDYVCADFYCTTLNNTTSPICPLKTASIHPWYYAIKPPDPDSYACSFDTVYSNEGYGAISFKTGKTTESTPYGKPGHNYIEYDEYYNNYCDANNWVNVPTDHFRKRGNFQGCGSYYTSEIVDTGHLLLSERGRDTCINPVFEEIYAKSGIMRGEYDRIVPRKVHEENRDVDVILENGGSGKSLPASFALENGHEVGILADLLDAQCRYPNVDELSFSGKGVNNDMQCNDIYGCVWNDALRQCVASQLNVEANFCPMIEDEDQCLLTGFCNWNENDDSCFHSSSQDLEYDPRRNKENLCEIIFDPIKCGKASCIWDMVQQSCFATWDKVAQLHPEIINSAIDGSSKSLHDANIKINPDGNTKRIDEQRLWPACSTPGKMDKGDQLSDGEWTYYPSPAVDTFIGGYEQNDNVGVGMRWELHERREQYNVRTTKVFIKFNMYYWREPSVEEDISSTNKICFNKNAFNDKILCEGYGFIWGKKNNVCWFNDDGDLQGVNELVPIAARTYYYDVPFLYNIGNDPDQHDWDDMVDAHFDNNDHEEVHVHNSFTYHGYQFVRFGCYTKLTKAHCENREGLNQDKFLYGLRYQKPDNACIWLPLIDKCIARSNKYNVYKSVFQMPSNVIAYNNTIGVDFKYPNGNNYIPGIFPMDQIDRDIFHWDSQYVPNYSPVQAEELIDNLGLCTEHLIYDECIINEACFWDFEKWSCKPALCNAVQMLMPSETLERMTGKMKDFRETNVRAKTCQRMKGCAIDPITHTCGPDPNQNFFECEDGYTMVNSYMDAKICPDHQVVSGDYCVDHDKLHCPWGISNNYQPSFRSSYELQKPELVVPFFGDVYWKFHNAAQQSKWGDGKEYPRIKHSACNNPSEDKNKWKEAKWWKNDNSVRHNNLQDQGVNMKCIKHETPEKDPLPTREHLAGEFSASNRAFCAALQQQYGLCDVHISGKDFVCMTMNGDCTLRYLSIESISLNNIHKWYVEKLYRHDVTDIDDMLVKIYDYVDPVFDSDSDAFFTMYFAEADLYLIDGLKDNILSSQQIEERFSNYYISYSYKNLTGYHGFNDSENYPKYEPTYDIITIPTLDLMGLRTEYINKMIIDPKKDIMRCVFAETYTDKYFQWREVQMAAIDEHIDNDMHITLAIETSQLRHLFWDQQEYLSTVFNYIWSGEFRSDKEYREAIDTSLLSSKQYKPPYGIDDMAKAYLTSTLSEIYFNRWLNFYGSLEDPDVFLYTIHTPLAIYDWVETVDDLLDTSILLRTRYNFDYDTTVDIIDAVFGGKWQTTGGGMVDMVTWPDVVIERRPVTLDVVKAKLMKKISSIEPFNKKTGDVRNHLELGVQNLWKRLPPKPPTLPKPPVIIEPIPVPEQFRFNKYKKITKIPPGALDAYIIERFIPPSVMRTDIWVDNGAIESHHAVMIEKFKKAFEIHKIWSETAGKRILEKGLLRKLNREKHTVLKTNRGKILKARSKIIESVRLRNQLIAITNQAQLLQHNINIEKFNSVLSNWNDNARFIQRPNVKVVQGVDNTDISALKKRVPLVINALKITKQPVTLSLVPKSTSKIVKVLKIWKESKIGKILRFMGPAFKLIYAVFNYADLAITIMEVFETIRFALENPAGCSVIDDFLGLPDEPSDAVINIFSPPKFALRMRVFLLQDFDGYSKEMRCAERMSWGMFNADGKYGIIDSRYNVPTCENNINYRQIDYHLSDSVKGLNQECTTDSQCSHISSMAQCVYNRCVANTQYIGMKYCKVKTKLVNVFLDQPLTRTLYLETDYDTFNKIGIKQPKPKYIHIDEFQFGASLLEQCNGMKFAQYEFKKYEAEGLDHIVCFSSCEQWINNINPNIETWMLTMSHSDVGVVTEYCTTSAECTDGGICSKDHKCTPPIECSSHRHCYGGYYLPGRLPRCDCATFKCIDDTEISSCTDIESCTEEANTICIVPDDTPKPTKKPTKSPTITATLKPTSSPSLSPTSSPTETVTLPPVYTPAPTNVQTDSPSVSPSLSPSLSPTLSPVTESPTSAPIVSGPFAGSECSFEKINYMRCRGTGNQLYMQDIDSVSEILYETEDYSTCDSACKNTKECKMYFVKRLADRRIECTYYHSDAILRPGFIANPGPEIIGCFEKQIPCIPTASPTVTPTIDNSIIAPTLSPTLSPTYNISNFDLVCSYGKLFETKLDNYKLWKQVLQVDVDYQCMEECDKERDCTGFQYEEIARKCILFTQYTSTVHYTRALIYVKSERCPFTLAPTQTPTVYTTQYNNISEHCEYDELNHIGINDAGPLLSFDNVTAHYCIEQCDLIPVCSMVRYINSFCTLHLPTTDISHISYDDGAIWFNKTVRFCEKTDPPTPVPTSSPTVTRTTCNYTVTTNTTFTEFVVEHAEANNINDTWDCQKPCNERSTCEGFIYGDSSCVFMSSFNSTSNNTLIGHDIHIKNDSNCVATISPTESPTPKPTTLSPTSAPTIDISLIEFPVDTIAPTTRPTNSPTLSPTLSPTNSPTEVITCNYARLPGFGPRADALYTIQHETHNNSIPHTEFSCLLSCDVSDRCVSFTYNSDEESCVFYDILGPIELKLGEPVVLMIKSKSCTIPHRLDNEGNGGCAYSERSEQIVINGVSSILVPEIEHVASVLQCSEYCNQDGSCKIFDYNVDTLLCRKFLVVTEWGSNTLTNGYVKSDQYCVDQVAPTGNPTLSPTLSPTLTPTNSPSLSDNVIGVIDNTITIKPPIMVLIIMGAVMICGGCFILVFKRQRNGIPLDFLVIPTIELDLE